MLLVTRLRPKQLSSFGKINIKSRQNFPTEIVATPNTSCYRKPLPFCVVKSYFCVANFNITSCLCRLSKLFYTIAACTILLMFIFQLDVEAINQLSESPNAQFRFLSQTSHLADFDQWLTRLSCNSAKKSTIKIAET